MLSLALILSPVLFIGLVIAAFTWHETSATRQDRKAWREIEARKAARRAAQYARDNR